MTDKEIKSAMEACLNRTDRCVCTIEDCPYAWEDECSIDLWKDALNLINRQQAENEMLKRKLAMAKEDLKHTCTTCFYMEEPSQEVPCRDCRSFNKWKWRGDEDDSE